MQKSPEPPILLVSLVLCFTVFLCMSFFLKGRNDRDRSKVLFSDSLPKCPQQPRLGLTKSRSLIQPGSPPCGAGAQVLEPSCVASQGTQRQKAGLRGVTDWQPGSLVGDVLIPKQCLNYCTECPHTLDYVCGSTWVIILPFA